jgi:hypothetical protein
VGVVGDSVMASLAGGLQAEASARGWSFASAAVPACPVGYEQLYQVDGTTLGSCSEVRALHDQLIATKPNLIIWHDLQSSLARRSASGRLLQPGTSAWEADLLAEWTLVLERFRDVGAEVVIVLPPLRSQSPVGCGAVANQVRCLEIQSQDTAIRKATQDFIASLNGEVGVHLITVDSLLCPAGNPCPRRVGGMEVRYAGWDQTHFTSAGALWMAPRLLNLAVTAVEAAP